MINYEVGMVLYCKQPKTEYFYFIYDVSKDKIFYSMYKFKDKKMTFKRFECFKNNILDKKLKSSEIVANGKLVKRLLETDTVK